MDLVFLSQFQPLTLDPVELGFVILLDFYSMKLSQSQGSSCRFDGLIRIG